MINVYFNPSRSSRPEVFCKNGVLRNFTKLTGKHLRQSLFFNKVVGLRPATLLKRRLWHRCSCEFCEISENTFFYRTPLAAASVPQNLKFPHTHLHQNCTRHLAHLLCLHLNSFHNLLWYMRQCRVIHFECRNMIQDHIFWNKYIIWVPEFLRVLAWQIPVFHLVKIVLPYFVSHPWSRGAEF